MTTSWPGSRARCSVRPLGGGEDNLWDRDVLGYWFGPAAGREGGDPLPYDARPVLAHVGQLGLAAGVANGVEPVGQAAGQDVVGLQADDLQPHAGQEGATASCDQDLISLDGSTGAGDRDGAAVDATEPGVTGLRPLGGNHLGIRDDGDATGGESLLDESGGEGLRGRQEAGAAHQHGDVAAQGGHPGGGLTGDDPTDDDEALRDLLHAGGATLAPGLKALERSRHDGLRASGENDGAARDPLVVAREQIWRGQLGGAQATEVCRRRGDLNGPEERLAGHAGVIRALAAQGLALDEDRGQVGALGGVLRDTPPAHHRQKRRRRCRPAQVPSRYLCHRCCHASQPADRPVRHVEPRTACSGVMNGVNLRRETILRHIGPPSSPPTTEVAAKTGIMDALRQDSAHPFRPYRCYHTTRNINIELITDWLTSLDSSSQAQVVAAIELLEETRTSARSPAGGHHQGLSSQEHERAETRINGEIRASNPIRLRPETSGNPVDCWR